MDRASAFVSQNSVRAVCGRPSPGSAAQTCPEHRYEPQTVSRPVRNRPRRPVACAEPRGDGGTEPGEAHHPRRERPFRREHPCGGDPTREAVPGGRARVRTDLGAVMGRRPARVTCGVQPEQAEHGQEQRALHLRRSARDRHPGDPARNHPGRERQATAATQPIALPIAPPSPSHRTAPHPTRPCHSRSWARSTFPRQHAPSPPRSSSLRAGQRDGLATKIISAIARHLDHSNSSMNCGGSIRPVADGWTAACGHATCAQAAQQAGRCDPTGCGQLGIMARRGD